jgi:D-beta-D-heptose 7-phosphate kinase/D-beta-D-heptose 1-phosphate adenosyltransferase
MSKIITVEKAINLSNKFREDGKIIVLTGGCFDVLHLGHIKFIEAAKKRGDLLFVFVESDEKVRKLKGKNRPINNQDERAEVLAAIQLVDYVIKIPFFEKNASYDKLITSLHPSIIATTKESGAIKHAQRQAQKINAQVAQVIGLINDKSTSKIAKIISDENQL